jgi:hypothetical protein
MDGSNFELPDEADNAEHLRPPRQPHLAYAGYPQAQCAVLVECATHAILGANLGPYRTPASGRSARRCWPACSRAMLCMADRGFNGYEHWREARATGAELLWRCSRHPAVLPVVQQLEDGSYLSIIAPAGV